MLWVEHIVYPHDQTESSVFMAFLRFFFFLYDLFVIVSHSVYEKCIRGALHISVNIHTVHGCTIRVTVCILLDKGIGTRGNILPVYVFMFP